MQKIIKFISLVLLVLSTHAVAQTRGDWSGSYGFPSSGASRQAIALTQADLIAKKDGGYYDGLGKNTINSTQINTYSVGALDQSTTNIQNQGSGTVTFTGGARSEGSLNSSVGITDIRNSNVSTAPTETAPK